MPCFHPVKAYRSLQKGADGRYGITFNPHKAWNDLPMQTFPCNRCIGCRIDVSKQWAMRCMHESQMHPDNCFITLTYDEEHAPTNMSLDVREWQLFAKRLRKSLRSKKIRYFACGEYGDENQRPHYHALIFNHDFPDRVLWKATDQGNTYTSESLQKLWPYGFSTLADLTYKTAAYVARYALKKIGGNQADEHYLRLNPLNGNVYTVEPEFAVQSRRPGIGSTWYDKFKSDAFPSDFLIVDGKRHTVPRYYTNKLEEDEKQRIKRSRKAEGRKHREHSTPERLRVRETILKSRISMLKRSLKEQS